jgi:hypothetical protein
VWGGWGEIRVNFAAINSHRIAIIFSHQDHQG